MKNEKIWRLKPIPPNAHPLARETGISPLQARLLINRGISGTDSVSDFLAPRLSGLMDPLLLKDMDAALDLIIRALENREKISVYGDYDADGITSTALLINFFKELEIPVSFHIPNRLREGYGLHRRAVEQMANEGCGLVITVDCGTANRKEIEHAMACGMKVVVTDHHQVPKDFDPVCPVVNPHREDSLFPFRELAGVGVAFFLAVALRAALRERAYFRNRPEPDLRNFLDLVALGTVADMVPLLDQNRILVNYGLEVLKTSSLPGIRALQETADMPLARLTPNDLAFRLAPRLNASGRMGSAERGVRILTTDDPSVARDLGEALNNMNSRRQGIEQEVLAQIEEMILSTGGLEARRTLVLSGRGWHKGVLGIVASRLVERYYRPALVINIQEGMATGSGRSIDGFNLHEVLVRYGNLFERFGGHRHAVGFTLEESHVETLSQGLEDAAWRLLSEEDLIPVIEIDGEVTLQEMTMETLQQIESLAPFGPGNPEPVFYSPFLEVLDSRVVGERHLKLKVGRRGNVHEAIGFGLGDLHPLGGEPIRMVFTPEINEWQGYKRIQLRIVDLEPVNQNSSKMIRFQ